MNRGRWLRRAFTLSLVALCAANLPACEILQAEPDGWEKTPSHAPLPPVYHPSTAAWIQQECPPHNCPPWATQCWTNACAKRDYAAHECNVLGEDYTLDEMPGWLREHELKHCAGYDHG